MNKFEPKVIQFMMNRKPPELGNLNISMSVLFSSK